MTLQAHPNQLPAQWETTLLAWAQHPLENHSPHNAHAKHHSDAAALEVAYAHCAAMTREHSKTFFIASGLLPPDQRRAARALYAFCRVTDNIVDDSDKASVDKRADLEQWRELTLAPHPQTDDLVALAWADARHRHNIPTGYAEQLIDGVAQDLEQTRYATFDELAAYSYGVASTVGLMAMHIIGYAGEAALPYAVKLGVALQLTNILRDVGDDWRLGRLYLPQDELAAYGLSEADIRTLSDDPAAIDARWREFMDFQITRNRQLYDAGLPGIALLNAEGRFAIAAAAELYRAILGDIEAHGYDVFSRRAHIGTVGKLRRLPMIWWGSRTATLPA
ncbi:MAG: phytoene/squalene synthase family protein [Chloroflexi bacterium]|nr:phytoene/squalene synthase family protein [Chloroflexota bacterium]